MFHFYMYLLTLGIAAHGVLCVFDPAAVLDEGLNKTLSSSETETLTVFLNMHGVTTLFLALFTFTASNVLTVYSQREILKTALVGCVAQGAALAYAATKFPNVLSQKALLVNAVAIAFYTIGALFALRWKSVEISQAEARAQAAKEE